VVPADVHRVVVEQTDVLEFRDEVRVDLLAPLALQAAQDAAVARVQVAADAHVKWSWRRASPPARVRFMRKMRSPSRRTRYGMICLREASVSASGLGTYSRPCPHADIWRRHRRV
jgi:hypothetical protein